MLRRAVFLDRDGTINHDPGYIKDPNDVEILPGVPEGIRKLKEDFDFSIIVISNQAGVAKGLMTREDVNAVNNRINELLMIKGASIDAFYYCPYHPEFDPPEKSNCRKPSPFMIVQASKEHQIELNKSFMIGDKTSDVESGLNAGVKTILIGSPIFQNEISVLHNLGKKPNFVAANFQEACEFIIKDFLEDIT